MLFHRIVETTVPRAANAPNPVSGLGIEASAKPAKQRQIAADPLKIGATLGAIVFFTIAAFVAHAIVFQAGETIFLNLTVATTSAFAGAFLGEKLAFKDVGTGPGA
jgi:hypothetical protein